MNSSLIKGQAVDVLVPLLRPYDRAMALQLLEGVARAVDDQYGHSVFDPSVKLREVGMVDWWRARVYVDDEVSDSSVKHDLLMQISDVIEASDFCTGCDSTWDGSASSLTGIGKGGLIRLSRPLQSSLLRIMMQDAESVAGRFIVSLLVGLTVLLAFGNWSQLTEICSMRLRPVRWKLQT